MTTKASKFRAVVFDIGAVLEGIDDSAFPAPFELRHGLGAGAVEASMADLRGRPSIGEMTSSRSSTTGRAVYG